MQSGGGSPKPHLLGYTYTFAFILPYLFIHTTPSHCLHILHTLHHIHLNILPMASTSVTVKCMGQNYSTTTSLVSSTTYYTAHSSVLLLLCLWGTSAYTLPDVWRSFCVRVHVCVLACVHVCACVCACVCMCVHVQMSTSA